MVFFVFTYDVRACQINLLLGSLSEYNFYMKTKLVVFVFLVGMAKFISAESTDDKLDRDIDPIETQFQLEKLLMSCGVTPTDFKTQPAQVELSSLVLHQIGVQAHGQYAIPCMLERMSASQDVFAVHKLKLQKMPGSKRRLEGQFWFLTLKPNKQSVSHHTVLQKQDASLENVKNLESLFKSIFSQGFLLEGLSYIDKELGLSGSIGTAEKKAQLEKILSESKLTAKLEQIQIAPTKEVVLDRDLPNLLTKSGPRVKYKIHAVEASGVFLHHLLTEALPGKRRKKLSIISEASNQDVRVTGRILSKNSNSALKALEKEYPKLKVSNFHKSLKGRRRKVTLSFQSVDPVKVFGLLGEVGRINYVVQKQQPKLRILVYLAPFDAVADALANNLGLVKYQRTNTIYYLPKDYHFNRIEVKESKRFSFWMDQVDPAIAIQFLSEHIHLPFSLACQEKSPITLDLRSVTAAQTIQAILLLAGLDSSKLSKNEMEHCKITRLKKGNQLDHKKVYQVGSIIGIKSPSALLEDHQKNFFLAKVSDPFGAEAQVKRVTRNLGVMLETVIEGYKSDLKIPYKAKEASHRFPKDLSTLRLAATVQTHSKKYALFETNQGEFISLYQREDTGYCHHGPPPFELIEWSPARVTINQRVSTLSGKKAILRWEFELARPRNR